MSVYISIDGLSKNQLNNLTIVRFVRFVCTISYNSQFNRLSNAYNLANQSKNRDRTKKSLNTRRTEDKTRTTKLKLNNAYE